jgi:hypothetical protein
MKNAYVSIVLPVPVVPAPRVIEAIDAALDEQTRAHEIVIVTPYGQSALLQDAIAVRGPVSILATHMRSTPDGAIIAGLARTVGDFVIEWRGPLDEIDGQLINDLLVPSDGGVELVEAIGVETSQASRLFNSAVNSLRPRQAPLRKTIGRVYSRHAVQAILGATAFEPQLDVLVAELPVHRASHSVPHPNPHRTSLTQRLNDGFALLSKGTRFGSAIPLTLAAISALFGIAAAIYALGFLLLRGQTPEGWTTLMVVTGLGQAAILTMLGLTWTRIDALTRGLSRSQDPTATVEVIAPTNGITGVERPPKFQAQAPGRSEGAQ